MAILKLKRLSVRLARANRSGTKRAPDGLYVYLDAPGDQSKYATEPFDFQEFQVKRGRLCATGASTQNVPLDTSLGYWCVWSKTKMSAKKISGSFKEITGFGYPLQVRFSRKKLILPNWRRLRLRTFNLSGERRSHQEITNQLRRAQEMFDKVHVKLEMKFRRPPRCRHPETRRRGKWPPTVFSTSNQETKFYAYGTKAKLKLPRPGTKRPWLHRSSWWRKRSIILLWVAKMQGAKGIAAMVLPLSGQPVAHWKKPHNLKLYPNRHSSIVVLPVLAGANSYGLAHEIGHCILEDAGLGHVLIDKYSNWKARVKSKLIKKLGFITKSDLTEKKLEKTYREVLTRYVHTNALGNLMNPDGGTELLYTQVAVMRRSRLLY
jgi:hypothetical protein